MRRVLVRCVLGLVSSLAALSLSCGSGDSEGLFTSSSVAGGGADGVAGSAVSAGSSGIAGSHASAGMGGSAHAGSPGTSAGAGGKGQAGSASGGNAGSSTGGAGQPAGGRSGSAGGGGASAGTAGAAGKGNTGGGAGAGGATCVDNSGCTDLEYCAKSSCAAKAEGRCTVRPTDCANAKLGVFCGCNGLTYHDQCLMHEDGQNSSAAAPCTKAEKVTVTCTFLDDTACVDAGGECALKAEACGNVPVGEIGTCWVLPDACPGSDGQTAQLCGDQVDLGCQSECAAIKAKARYSTPGKCN